LLFGERNGLRTNVPASLVGRPPSVTDETAAASAALRGILRSRSAIATAGPEELIGYERLDEVKGKG
jgi:hypothetical protein